MMFVQKIIHKPKTSHTNIYILGQDTSEEKNDSVRNLRIVDLSITQYCLLTVSN